MGRFFGSKQVWVLFLSAEQVKELALDGDCAVQQLIPMTNPPMKPKSGFDGRSLNVTVQLAASGPTPGNFKLILVQADENGQLPEKYHNKVAGAQCLYISAEIPFPETDGKS